MTTYDFDLGVIGGGAAGLTITAGAARLGAKTLLVEKEPLLGGDCLHYGCVPSKTLIKSASVYHSIKNSHRFGLPNLDLPPIDFHKISQHIRAVIASIQHHDSVERFCGLGARVEFGPARFVDEHTIAITGRRFTAKQWVIATGSAPAIPQIPGLAQTAYLTNKEIFYLDRLPASMIILGAGAIAMEMAQAFSRLGTRVEVLQRSGQILSKEDKDLADIAMRALSEEGVNFHLDTTVLRARELGNCREILFRDNSSGKEIDLKAEAILVAMGRAPNIQDLGLAEIDLDFSAKGISVDNRLRTNHPHIYAAGDVTGKHQFTHAAGYEGGVVISNAIFHLPRKTDYTWLPWCTYIKPELASIGLNEKRALAAGVDYTVWQEDFIDNDRSRAEGNELGCIKLLLNKKEKPLGVQILGPHAGELLNEWVGLLNSGGKLATLASAIHPYPTFGEINKRVAGKFLSEKLFSNKVRKALSFFFSLRGRACELDEMRGDR
ncbi:MAG TPA: FAD-dependent oxidoreductase [Deltaproteobacteria bacterium]|nr:FAD-dependent oxidoreductase [Deltaproteobacteria bacterium]